MSVKSERKRIRKLRVNAFLENNPTETYDAFCRRVNQSYEDTGDIRQTMEQTGSTFDEVWDATGFKDYFDFVEV